MPFPTIVPSPDVVAPVDRIPGTADPRFRLRAMTNREQVYGPQGSFLSGLLYQMDGIVSLDTPTVNISQNARFNDQVPQHSNMQHLWWGGSAETELSVSVPMSSRYASEAAYHVAVVHMLRYLTRGYFGSFESPALRGYPPPVLSLTVFGFALIRDVPVVLSSWSASWPSNVDFVVPGAHPVFRALPERDREMLNTAIPADWTLELHLRVYWPFRDYVESFDLIAARSSRGFVSGPSFL